MMAAVAEKQPTTVDRFQSMCQPTLQRSRMNSSQKRWAMRSVAFRRPRFTIHSRAIASSTSEFQWKASCRRG